MAANSGMFSNTDDAPTQPELATKLKAELRFTIDVVGLSENAKLKNIFSPEVDGLTRVCSGTCWLNPPDGKEIPKWMHEAFSEHAERQLVVVCLVDEPPSSPKDAQMEATVDDVVYSTDVRSPMDWAPLFRFPKSEQGSRQISRCLKDGTYHGKQITTKKWRIAVDDLPHTHPESPRFSAARMLK